MVISPPVATQVVMKGLLGVAGIKTVNCLFVPALINVVEEAAVTEPAEAAPPNAVQSVPL